MRLALRLLLGTLALALALPLLLLGSCVLGVAGDARHEAWRQRMTLAVETPAGMVEGSAVQAIAWSGWEGGTRRTLGTQQGRGTSWEVTGGAVALEVAPGRWLFALLTGPGGFIAEPGKNLAYALVKDTPAYVSTPEAMDSIGALAPEAPVALPREAYPLLVTFDDPADPASVRHVDPDDLAASFGPGVRLTGVTVEITSEPVTEGQVEAVLPCLRQEMSCIPLNLELPYEHPMQNVPNSSFVRK